jgi:hypothetical protein
MTETYYQERIIFNTYFVGVWTAYNSSLFNDDARKSNYVASNDGIIVNTGLNICRMQLS